VTRYLRKDPTIKSSSNVLNLAESTISSAKVTPASFVVGGAYKRILDIAVSGAAIVLLSPILAIVAVAIKLCDGGPIFFMHGRIGFGGQPFTCLKFRTMNVDAEPRLKEYLLANPLAAEEWNTTQKLKRDPRLTAIGGPLRRSSIDELPQLINVLRGDMSLVGPRPVVAEEVARYGRDVAHYFSVRPGLTGAWQVSGRNDLSYAERVRLDAEYCMTWSPIKDVLIMLRTIPILFSGRGSY
jgi:exopolysaccharide production protein ExoY